MIRLIEALNYRCLRYVRQPLGPFHILVGPNASGKTTFLDVVSFLGDLVSGGLAAAVGKRTANFQDLVWGRDGKWFELAIEAEIPETQRRQILKPFEAIRYEVRIGLEEKTGQLGIREEGAWLTKGTTPQVGDGRSSPGECPTPLTLVTGAPRAGRRRVFRRTSDGKGVDFLAEANKIAFDAAEFQRHEGWLFRLSLEKSGLDGLPGDESVFPVSTWLRAALTDGIRKIALGSQGLRRASPPDQNRLHLNPDGSNLPWVVAGFRKHAPARFREWIKHLRTALPDLKDVQTVEREDDRHRYVVLCYQGGLRVPSWTASDGTLDLLALTLPAYLPGVRGVYLIEEPENGVHPCALETVYQSLSSVYDAQVLLATHSPMILSMAKPEQVLCFRKTPLGATDIVPGDQHPRLRDWKGDPNLSEYFASGVLG